jgi:phosphatidyl-myo-inositol dimannoside synthase
VSRSRRVVLLTPDFPPAHGGIQLTAHRLVSHWAGLETLVLTRRQGHGLGPRGGLALLNLAAIVKARFFRPDIVLSMHIVMSPAAWAIHRMIGTPYVQYLHGAEIADRPRLAHFAVQHAAAITAVSEHTASLVAKSVRRELIHLIYPGVDIPRSRLSERSTRPLIVTVSRLAERYKGHDVMLRALPLVRARIPEVQWVVIGDGPLRPSYERMASALGVSDQVRFLGSVDDRERDLWLDRAHLFAMPSRLSARGAGEGFGIAYLEAGAHRLPVVAGNIGGAVDAVIDGVTGRLVDPTDHLAVGDIVTDLLRDRRGADHLGRAGESRARTFAWARTAQQVERLMEEVVSARAA